MYVLYFHWHTRLSTHVSHPIKVRVNPVDWEGYTEPNPPAPPPPPSGEEAALSSEETAPLIGHWNDRLTEFQKLIMVRIFKEEKVRGGIYVVADPLNRIIPGVTPSSHVCTYVNVWELERYTIHHMYEQGFEYVLYIVVCFFLL